MKLTTRKVSFFLLACVTLCLTGCFSIESAHSAKSGEEHVVVRNYGWRLFYFIPVVCGNSDENSFLPWSFFSNDVTMDKVQKRFTEYAAKQRKTPVHIEYSNYDTVLWAIPEVNIPFPVPYFLCYNEIQLSGRLK